MLKLNNKGFAISTMLYGLLVIVMLLVPLLMNTLAFTRKNSSEFVKEIRDKLEKKEVLSTKTYTGLNGLGVIKNYGQESSEVLNINASPFVVSPEAKQYGPYDKTIVAGEYKVEYNGSFLNSIEKENISCSENEKADTCTIDGSTISINANKIEYIASISEDANYNGIEFSIMNNSAQGVWIDSITIRKMIT